MLLMSERAMTSGEWTRPEFMIDSTLVYGPPGGQGSPAIAFDGVNYFVVWNDSRRGNPSIYGARVNPDTGILDTLGIPISLAGYTQRRPAIAFGSNRYMVIWEHRGVDYSNSDIYGTPVSLTGEILDTVGIPIAVTSSHECAPSLAFDGTNFLVVWCDEVILGVRMTPNGKILDPIPISVYQDADIPLSTAVAYDGKNYLVVWADLHKHGLFHIPYFDIYGARVTPDGEVLDPRGIPITFGDWNQHSPSIAYDGTNYLVVWQGWGIRGTRMNTAGQVLDGHDGFPISSEGRSPSVIFDGTNYLVVWAEKREGATYDIYMARVSTDGKVLDPGGIPISTAYNQNFPVVATSGQDYLIVWQENSNVYGAKVDFEMATLDIEPIAQSALPSYHPQAASNGSNYLVVWEDYRNDPCAADIYGARIKGDGTILDPIGISISSLPECEHYPRIASCDSNYVVLWEVHYDHSSDIYGAFVSASGEVLTNFILSTNAKNASITTDDVYYMVVWQGYNPNNIYGTRLSQRGQILDTVPIPLVHDVEHWQGSPAITFGEDNYFMVWEDYPTYWIGRILGTRISPEGAVLDTNFIVISEAEGLWLMYPQLAFDGENFLVVWHMIVCPFGKNLNDTCGIYGALVSKDGTVIDSNIQISGAKGFYPKVVFDEKNFFVTWQDFRNGHYDLYGAYVRSTGEVIGEFPLFCKNYRMSPYICQDDANSCLIVYQKFTQPPYSSYKIWDTFFDKTGIEASSSSDHQLTCLLQNYPNPFNHITVIKCQIPDFSFRSPISLKIYDISGRLIKILIDELTLDSYLSIPNSQLPLTVMWDGRDTFGNEVRSGIYFCRLKVGQITQTRKILVIK